MGLKSFDINSLKKLLSSQSSDDLNRFLEKLPQNAGQTALIAAAIAWAMAATFGLYTAVQTQNLTELRATLKETEALKPAVPKIKNVPIAQAQIDKFIENAQKSYRGIQLKANKSTIIISANSTANFTEFREALGHVQNGGNQWRVSLDKLCVGRECDNRVKLMASLKVNKVSVEKL